MATSALLSLDLQGDDLAELQRSMDLSAEVAILLTTCREPSENRDQRATRYWITAVTETGVVTLQEESLNRKRS